MERKKLTVNNNQEELEQIQEFIDSLGDDWGLDERLQFRLNLVLEEYINNLISYGYSDQLPHQITVELEQQEDVIRVCVTDDGNPFDLTKVSENTEIEKPLEERKIGGLGIHFIRTLATDVMYNSENGINKMTITFKAKDLDL